MTERHSHEPEIPPRFDVDGVCYVCAMQQNINVLTRDLWEAFLAGFQASGEGFNGEYPFGDKGIDPSDNIRPSFEEWLAQKKTQSGHREEKE